MFPYLYYRTDSELMLQEVRGLELSGRLPGRAQILKLLRLHGSPKSDGKRGLWTGVFKRKTPLIKGYIHCISTSLFVTYTILGMILGISHSYA